MNDAPATTPLATKQAPYTSKATARRKMLWFVALYLGGVIAVAGLSYALRLLII